VIGPLTGAAINPARMFGPWVASSLTGGGAPWSQAGAYIVGSLVGGCLAAVAYDLLARPRAAEEPGAQPAQGTQGDIAGHRVSDREVPAEPAGSVPSAGGEVAGRDTG
jgi:glycerol uptake facilitator protein